MKALVLRTAMRVANGPKLLVTCIATDILVGGLLYALIEHHGPVEGMWWAVVTGSTVGYGDQYPKTTAGRFIGVCVIISCILFVAIATAQLSAKLIVNSDAWTDDEQEEAKFKLNFVYDWVVEQKRGPVIPVNREDVEAMVNLIERSIQMLRKDWNSMPINETDAFVRVRSLVDG